MPDPGALWSPRLPAALAANGGLAGLGLCSGAIDRSAALCGGVCGLLVYVAFDWPGYLLLGLFVVAGSAFTRLGGARKPPHGARTWRNAVANCGVAAGCGAGALLLGGAGWAWAATASLAAALADTSESELGPLVGRTARNPLTWRPVAAGTEGAVSLAGTALGLLAALALCGLAAALGVVPAGAVAGLAVAALGATVLESLLGSWRTLNNELLNLVTTGTAAVLGAVLARWLGA